MTKLSEILWLSIGDVYDAIIKHPFIRGLVDGSLSEDRFKYYIAQDHMYLGEYIKALSVIAAKAPKVEEAQVFLRHSIGAIEVERRLHEHYMRIWNLNPAEYVMSPTNKAYTSFLLTEAYSKPYYEAIAAVLPCYWIYERVGVELSRYEISNENYRLWASTYSGEEYRASVREVLGIVDSMSVTEGQLNDMIKAFRLASIYEYMFWDSAYRMEKWPINPNP
ncbi:thiaminase II [Caldivirga sp.]|uniref:thiaminase II n=1 Tax=Caldivirga sp. TaxID=2080243 RepID=UPI003D14933F